jgi:hypothetical protein
MDLKDKNHMTKGQTKKNKEPKARPIRVRIYYEIIEKICEQGKFIRNGNTIDGFRNYYYTSGLWLTWKLPRSKKVLLQSINKWKWRMPGINYDHSKMDIESRHQDHFDDFDINKKPIQHYDDFHGLESTIVTEIKNKSGPSEIKVFYEDGEEKKIKIRNRNSVVKEIERILV